MKLRVAKKVVRETQEGWRPSRPDRHRRGTWKTAWKRLGLYFIRTNKGSWGGKWNPDR